MLASIADRRLYRKEIMHRFWDAVIEPILDSLQPEAIVEVGSEHGPNTRNLLEFCRRHGARLHVVDPMPKYDIAAWRERYGEHVVFHLSLSLEAIPLIDEFDVVLIDGDHNWYTVYNELKLIEHRCKELSQPFPLVMLHDIGWPYGRRDRYYNPDDIPDRYLNPYEKKGIQLGSEELVEKGGFNRAGLNAVREGNPQNGVLTAVEDFLEEADETIELVKIPGFHGLGILIPLRVKEQIPGFSDTLALPPNLTRHVQRLEQARLEAEIEQQECTAAFRHLEVTKNREVEGLGDQLKRLRKQRQIAVWGFCILVLSEMYRRLRR